MMRAPIMVLVFLLGLVSCDDVRGQSTDRADLPGPVLDDRDDWQLVGEARLRKFFFHVYDGFLWAPEGEWRWDRPFVVDFEYARSLDGEDIAERGAEEIQKLGHCETLEDCWLDEQRQAFPDVKEGDRLTGWYQPGGPVRFYFNGQLQHVVEDPDFGRPFFEIWLSPETSEPSFREDLLGQ